MSKGRHSLRIIGGRWRSRKLEFPAIEGLRPTPDRVRETLFNWLQGELQGARVLDMFAGSGALGLESLSRGAKEAVFVERTKRASAAIAQSLGVFDMGPEASNVQADALKWITTYNDAPFDLAFVDPPYVAQLLERSLGSLCSGALVDKALVYIEHPRKESPALPENFSDHRRLDAGSNSYRLLRYTQAL